MIQDGGLHTESSNQGGAGFSMESNGAMPSVPDGDMGLALQAGDVGFWDWNPQSGSLRYYDPMGGSAKTYSGGVRSCSHAEVVHEEDLTAIEGKLL